MLALGIISFKIFGHFWSFLCMQGVSHSGLNSSFSNEISYLFIFEYLLLWNACLILLHFPIRLSLLLKELICRNSFYLFWIWVLGFILCFPCLWKPFLFALLASGCELGHVGWNVQITFLLNLWFPCLWGISSSPRLVWFLWSQCHCSSLGATCCLWARW